MIVAEAIGHRARFAWLGAALAATIAIFLVTAGFARGTEHGRRGAHRALDAGAFSEVRVRRCGQHLIPEISAERAEHRAMIRALHEARRAEHRARREAARAARAARAAQLGLE